MVNSLSPVVLISTLSVLSSTIAYVGAATGSNEYDPYYYYGNSGIDSSDSATQTFKKADNNKDSTVTLDEFLQADPTYNAIRAKVKDGFDKIDTNGDGVISKSEQDTYIQYLKDAEHNLQIEDLNNTIENFDKGDGKLQAAELLDFLDRWYSLKPMDGITIATVMAPFDADHDNALSAAELYDFESNIPYDQLVSTYYYGSTAGFAWTTNYNFETTGTPIEPKTD